MTFQELMDEVELRLAVDGTSIYNFTDWDTPAVNALKRALDEFIIESRYRWLDRASVTLTADSRTQSTLTAGVAIPEFVFVAGEILTQCDMSMLRTGPLVEASATPALWGTGDRYSITFDVPILTATAALTTNAVSGWAPHSTITQTLTSGTVTSTTLDVIDPGHQRYLIAFCVYQMMADSIADTASSQRAKSNASNAFEFIRVRSAEVLQTEWQI